MFAMKLCLPIYIIFNTLLSDNAKDNMVGWIRYKLLGTTHKVHHSSLLGHMSTLQSVSAKLLNIGYFAYS